MFHIAMCLAFLPIILDIHLVWREIPGWWASFPTNLQKQLISFLPLPLEQPAFVADSFYFNVLCTKVTYGLWKAERTSFCFCNVKWILLPMGTSGSETILSYLCLSSSLLQHQRAAGQNWQLAIDFFLSRACKLLESKYQLLRC